MDLLLHAYLWGVTACLSSCVHLCEPGCDCAALCLHSAGWSACQRPHMILKGYSPLAAWLAVINARQAPSKMAQCGRLLPVRDQSLV